jgi:hypothetical protein
VEQDDQAVVEAAKVAQEAFEGSSRPKENGTAEPREAPIPPVKDKTDVAGNLTEKEGRSTGGVLTSMNASLAAGRSEAPCRGTEGADFINGTHP